MNFSTSIRRAGGLAVALCALLAGAGTGAAQAPLQTLDDRFRSVAGIAPNFAGFHLEGNRLVISATGQNDNRAEIRAAIARVFQWPVGQLQTDIRFRRVSYTVAQLLDWQLAAKDVLNLKGVSFTDVDEVANRLAIGITSGADQEELSAFLRAAGVPAEAVDLVQTEPAQTFAGLRTRHRPVVGGVQIRFDSPPCTAGVPVTLASGGRGLLTNSHCTTTQGGTEGTVYRQPKAAVPSNIIGTELSDPPYTRVSPLCPSGRFCRMSDSALIRLDNGVTSSRGRIARPRAWGSRTVSTADPDFNVISYDPIIPAGTRVRKVGRTTGMTGGAIARTCVTIDQDDTPGLPPRNITLICQYRFTPDGAFGGGVTPLGNHGDSGSPVFRIRTSAILPTPGLPTPDNHVNMVGLLWGGAPNSIAFSPISSVVWELGQDVGDFQFTQ